MSQKLMIGMGRVWPQGNDYGLVNTHRLCLHPIDPNKPCYHDHPNIIPADLDNTGLGTDAKVWSNARRKVKFTIEATRTLCVVTFSVCS